MLDPVKKILEDRGIWRYFIFPSIDWSPKGARIARFDHSLTSYLAITGRYLPIVADLEILGYCRKDFESDVPRAKKPGIYLFSFGPDSWCATYEHIETRILVPSFSAMSQLCGTRRGFPKLSAPAS